MLVVMRRHLLVVDHDGNHYRRHAQLQQEYHAPDQQVAAALFAARLVLGVTLFYMRAGTWGQGGYIMAILLGLTTAWHYQLNKEDRPGEK